jgi:hypothetical protein
MNKKKPKYEVDFRERLKQRDIARGVTSPDNKTKGFRNKQRKQYLVIAPVNNTELLDIYLDIYRILTGQILWLTHHEVVEKKLMGYTIEPYDDKKHYWVQYFER